MAISSLYDSILRILSLFVDVERFGDANSMIIFLLGFGVVYFIISRFKECA